MVTFELIKKTEKELVYHYYPENKRNKEAGVIVVDLIHNNHNNHNNKINITKIAEEDFEYDITAEELNNFADVINQMMIENGRTEGFAKMTTEDEHVIYYGDHAVNEIIRHLREGKVPDEGGQFWY